jgi:hypothetical protein
MVTLVVGVGVTDVVVVGLGAPGGVSVLSAVAGGNILSDSGRGIRSRLSFRNRAAARLQGAGGFVAVHLLIADDLHRELGGGRPQTAGVRGREEVLTAAVPG